MDLLTPTFPSEARQRSSFSLLELRAVPSHSSKSPHATCLQYPPSALPALAPPPPHSRHTPLPSPAERNAAASSPPTESLPADWQFPSLRYPAPNRAPVHIIPPAHRRLPRPAGPASRLHRRPGLTKYRQTCSRSAGRQTPRAAAPAASRRNPHIDGPASPQDNPSPRASPPPARAGRLQDGCPCPPTEPCAAASSPTQNPRGRCARFPARRNAWC